VEDSLRRFLTREELAAAAFGRLTGSALTGLWVAGDLGCLAAPTVAIVGTRAPSDDGRRLAQQFASDLGAAGVCVISGLALGIDAAAHAGALVSGAPTVGVLGGGHDRFFPPRNADLARRVIAGGGAVLSPYPPEHPAYPWQFLARNGIVAALADGVVVIEAAARSGALNTASWAADRGVPVMAVPGDVGRPKVAGCLALIRDGATLVRDASDVLAQLGIAARAVSAPASAADPAEDPAVSRILRLLRDGPAGADAVVAACGLPPVLALARIGDLLAGGTIISGSDGRYAAAVTPGLSRGSHQG
jgi:DNA processing protein